MSIVQATVLKPTKINILGSYSDSPFSGNTANAFVTFESTGSLTTSELDSGDWIEPVSFASTDTFYIRATVIDGGTIGTLGGTFNTWLELSTNRTWYFSVTSSESVFDTASLNISIARDSGGTILLDSDIVTLVATTPGGAPPI